MLHALRYFKREQFLVLRYEDLMHMSGPAILTMLARFTGLHLNHRQLGNPRCQPARASGRSRKGAGPNSYSSNSPHAAEMLQEASPALERFFAPYNTMLQEIIGTSFAWSPKDHRKTPLSAVEKQAALETERKYRKYLRKRQVGKRLDEHAKRIQIHAAAQGRGSPARGMPHGRQQGRQQRPRGRGGRGMLSRGKARGRAPGSRRPPAGSMSSA